jgi:hypothetical protein
LNSPVWGSARWLSGNHLATKRADLARRKYLSFDAAQLAKGRRNMSVGTAIFLSSIVIGVVLLYGFTKDRWHWACHVRRVLVFSVLLISVLGGVAALLIYWNSQPQPPSAVTSLWGVTLGEAERDVVFRKGQPKRTCYHSADRKSLWYYVAGYSNNDGSWSQVVIDKNLGVTAIMFMGDLSKSDQELGKSVYAGESSDSVISRWGKPIGL